MVLEECLSAGKAWLGAGGKVVSVVVVRVGSFDTRKSRMTPPQQDEQRVAAAQKDAGSKNNGGPIQETKVA